MRADLSVIVTNYNKSADQLIECMDSIKQQTVAPKEVILVDDCSADPRAHALATSIILPKNVGVAKARDIGVKMATGRLLLFVDADDKLAPDYIQQCGRAIAKADIAYPNILGFGEGIDPYLQETPKEITPEFVLSKNCYIPVTSMIHKTMYTKLKGFSDYPVFEDWDFWIRAMFNGYTFAKANTLLYYRQTADSRNRANRETKNTVHYQITSPYVIREGKLKRKARGTKKT